jgi:hypothetical protein
MKKRKALGLLDKMGLLNLSEEQLAAVKAAMEADTIPAGTYRVKRLSAWLSRKGFEYVLSQKFRILEGPHAGRELVVTQELDDSDTLELKTDAPI